MEIITAKSAGFCFGVNRAINICYNEIEKGGKVYTLGPIIHNKEVNSDLASKGVIQTENIEDIKDGVVIIRSHGVEKSVYDFFDKNNINYVDGTCPFVKKIHNIVNNSYNNKEGIIIVGDPCHPEVKGINGWCENTAQIINSKDEADTHSFPKYEKYCLVVQTTFRQEKLESIINSLKQRGIPFYVNNTICSATSKRQLEAIELSKNVDKMIVIGDKSSSNTRKLYEICVQNCKKTYYIETFNDLVLNNFSKNDKIGLTAGASTPPAIIKEVVITMSEAQDKILQNSEENEELTFQQMLDESLVSLHTGDIVKGTVIQISNEEVSVNLGYKSDGIIPKGEFSSDPSAIPSKVLNVGDEIEVFVVRVNDGEGNVLLSSKRIESFKGMEDIEKAFEQKTPVTGIVKKSVKGGIIAVSNGVDVFIPSSQVSNRFVEDLSSFEGKELTFEIIEFDRSKRRIIGGRKDMINREISVKRAELFEKLKAGQNINGTVSRLTDFGAFVDLGGADGLIHISEMSWGRIANPKEILSEGDEVSVVILDINKEKGKISLSLKDTMPNPWSTVAEKYPVGATVEGKVVRMVPFGAFVELEPGVDGLVHISQIASKHVVKPEDELSIGQVISVRVLDVNPENKKISLSKKEADAPAEEAETTTEAE